MASRTQLLIFGILFLSVVGYKWYKALTEDPKMLAKQCASEIPHDTAKSILNMMQSGERILAIKRVNEQFPRFGQIECMMIIDALRQNHGQP